MKMFGWFKNRLSARYRAISLYRQGMKRAQGHDHRQAVVDYSLVIQMAEAPTDIIAMALYNRALVYDAMADEQHAIADLQAILTMSGTDENVRTEARRKLLRMQRSQQRSESGESMA